MNSYTKFTIQKSRLLIAVLFLGIYFISSNTHAQKIDVKGTVRAKIDNDFMGLMGVNVYLKDKTTITTTNRKGEFSFSKALNIGDVLVFSYLGYLTKEIKISKNSKIISVVLKEDDNEMLGAVNGKKRFSSKRKGL